MCWHVQYVSNYSKCLWFSVLGQKYKSRKVITLSQYWSRSVVTTITCESKTTIESISVLVLSEQILHIDLQLLLRSPLGTEAWKHLDGIENHTKPLLLLEEFINSHDAVVLEAIRARKQRNSCLQTCREVATIDREVHYTIRRDTISLGDTKTTWKLEKLLFTGLEESAYFLLVEKLQETRRNKC